MFPEVYSSLYPIALLRPLKHSQAIHQLTSVNIWNMSSRWLFECTSIHFFWTAGFAIAQLCMDYIDCTTCLACSLIRQCAQDGTNLRHKWSAASELNIFCGLGNVFFWTAGSWIVRPTVRNKESQISTALWINQKAAFWYWLQTNLDSNLKNLRFVSCPLAESSEL